MWGTERLHSLKLREIFHAHELQLLKNLHSVHVRRTHTRLYISISTAGKIKSTSNHVSENVIDSGYTHKALGAITAHGKLVTMKTNGSAKTQ